MRIGILLVLMAVSIMAVFLLLVPKGSGAAPGQAVETPKRPTKVAKRSNFSFMRLIGAGFFLLGLVVALLAFAFGSANTIIFGGIFVVCGTVLSRR